MGVEIKNYLPLVRSIAYKIYKKSNRKIDLEDLIGAGNFGLVKAIHTYTTGHGATFNTYASLKVWNTIMDELRYLNWVPRTTIKKENFKYPKIINIDEDIEIENDDNPLNDIIKKETQNIISEAIETLSDNEKKVINQIYYEDLSVSEIKDYRKVTDQAIYDTKRRALNKIRKEANYAINN